MANYCEEGECPITWIVASDSPVLKKLCQSVFPEGNYQLHLAASLDEVNRFLDSLTPESCYPRAIKSSIQQKMLLASNNRLASRRPGAGFLW